MQYKIILSRVGARHCRALTSVLDSTENRYITLMVNRPAFSGFSNAKGLAMLNPYDISGFLNLIFCVFCQCVSPSIDKLDK